MKYILYLANAVKRVPWMWPLHAEARKVCEMFSDSRDLRFVVVCEELHGFEVRCSVNENWFRDSEYSDHQRATASSYSNCFLHSAPMHCTCKLCSPQALCLRVPRMGISKGAKAQTGIACQRRGLGQGEAVQRRGWAGGRLGRGGAWLGRGCSLVTNNIRASE